MKIAVVSKFIGLSLATCLILLFDIVVVLFGLGCLMSSSVPVKYIFYMLFSIALAYGMTYGVCLGWRRIIMALKGLEPRPVGKKYSVTIILGFIILALLLYVAVRIQCPTLMKSIFGTISG